MPNYVLEIKNISKKYKNTLALENVSISIKKGDIYGFIGENGAGKTTLIRMITGLGFPNKGEIKLFGESETTKLDNQRKRIGCIIESPALYSNMTANQNLEIIRVQRGIPGSSCIDEVLKIVNLQDTGNKKVKNFSLGMKQRLALAIALLGDPEFLILDEAVNGLDPSGIVEFRNLLKKLNKERGITILISSHLLNELNQLATCYGFIHKGKIVEQITAKELDERCTKHINIKVDNVENAAFIIENNLNIEEFEVFPNNTIKIYNHLDEVKKISNEIVVNGIGIESINVQGEDLESYFTRLIGGATNV
ncbi:MAG: ABC transporter ATP-binding protein [Peptostreptococcaceae bacterium]